MALGQYRHPRHPVGPEMMQVDVQQRGLRCIHAAPERRLDQVDVVEPLGSVQIDDQVDAGAANAVAQRKMVDTLLGG